MRSSFISSQSKVFHIRYKPSFVQMHNKLIMLNRMKPQVQIPSTDCSSGVGNLFRCAKDLDYVLISVGTVLAALEGIGIPLFSLMWGNLIDSLINSSEALDKAKAVMLDFLYLGIGVFFAGWGSFTCWMITGSRQSIECRKLYLHKLLKQEIAWFDTKNQQQVSLKFSADCLMYERAIGQNFFSIVMISAMLIAGIVIAFIHGWLLSLVVFAVLPFLVYSYYGFGKASASKDKEEGQAFAEVGGNMEEIFSSIQTVKMLNGQDYEVCKFEKILDKAKQKVSTFIKWMAFYIAFSTTLLLLTFILGYWFGTKCVTGSDGCLTSYSGGTVYSAGNALLIIYSLVIPAINLNQLIISFEKIIQGKAAATRIFQVIDRVPLTCSSPNALVPSDFKGVFKFQNVSFTYPTSTEKILNGLNLEIVAKSTAIVGKSGCGKSTIFQLMMRFYDPSEGRVTLDGVDLKEINLEWLRKQIGYVGQEPVLFAMSVKENLLLGNPTASEEEIVTALKKAQAYDFVCELKDKFESFVGNGGNLISGGQKQRIAIARALVKNPQILLLDEATSSLDLVNEALIQDTLSKISQNIKTITIAHRKETIQANEELYYIQHGRIAMKGNYQDYKELIEKKNNELPFLHKISRFSSHYTPSIKETKLHMTKSNSVHTEIGLSNINEQVPQQIQDKIVWQRLYEYLKDYKLLLVVAIFVTILSGILFPLFGIFVSKILVIWIQYNPYAPDSSISQANQYSIYGLVISAGGFIVTAASKITFNRIGLSISSTIRKNAFEKIIRMPLSWFQAEENSSGHLSVSIDSDCNTINKFTSSLLMSILLLISGIFFGVVLAFVYEWRTSLVSLGLLPLIGLSGFMQLSFVAGLKSEMQKLFQSSANIINEAVKNIRTVASLAAQQLIEKRYEEKLSISHPAIVKKSVISGIFFGLSYMVMYVVIGIIVYLGINFQINSNLSTGDVFCAIYLITFSGLNSGIAILYFPDVNAAKTSLKRMFKLLSLKEERDIASFKNRNSAYIRGNIVFDKVFFEYEGSPYNILNNVSFEIKAGQKVGVVGHSGCGKSTIVKLIQGFYQPSSGVIRIDNVNLDDFNVHHLRQSIGAVNQQPVLFNNTVLNNIVYNRSGEAKDVLKLVSQSSFTPLSQLSIDHHSDDWLQAQVGFKGSHLSGGQKQRIAVLRALYRKPQMFLFDEATSALDQANQKMVLGAIAKSSLSKTVINVTHRLNCLSSFDTILVFKNGSLVEQGTFEDLVKRKGQFNHLLKYNQSSSE